MRHAETERETFDFVLIDCPPSLGLLTLNSLVASDAVLVPLQCEFYALEGLSMLLKTIERVRRVFNPSLEIQGVVLTMADQRNNLSEQVAADVREHLGEKVYETVIPRNVRVSEAPSHGLPALVYDLRCAGSQAYIHLAGEVIRRERSIAGLILIKINTGSDKHLEEAYQLCLARRVQASPNRIRKKQVTNWCQ